MNKNKYKCEITITDKNTGEKVVYKLDDFNINLTNDLFSVVTHSGDFSPAPMYSKGCFVDLTGYIGNKNVEKEIEEAKKEAASRVK